MQKIRIIAKNFFYLALIVVGIALIKNNDAKNNNPATETAAAKAPQEYMIDVFVTHFNSEGVVIDKIIAPLWAYLPHEGVSRLTAPSLAIMKPDNSIWNVNAKRGIATHEKLDSKITKLELQENVIVTRRGDQNIIPIDVTTEGLFYYPETEYVQTDKFVELVKPGLHITGVGLEGYFKENRVELQKDVKTTYISNS